MSAEAIAAHLTDRFALLKGGDRTALPRQQTLRAAIDWSYDLLAPPERALLQRLSVFAGGFALDAAEAVGAGDDVAPATCWTLLGHLVDKSLVAFDAQRERYRLLETVRQYARERLAESGEEARTRDRHLRYYVALAERAQRRARWAGAGCVGRPPRRRAREHPARVRPCTDRARGRRGGPGDGLRASISGSDGAQPRLWHRVVLEALAHPDAQQEDVARCRALYVAAQSCVLTGRYDEAFALAQSSVRIARACGDPQVLAEALYRLGVRGHRPRPGSRSARALRRRSCARAAGGRSGAGRAHCLVAWASSIRNRASSNSPRPHYLEALRAYRRRSRGHLDQHWPTLPGMPSRFAPRPRPCGTCARRWRPGLRGTRS